MKVLAFAERCWLYHLRTSNKRDLLVSLQGERSDVFTAFRRMIYPISIEKRKRSSQQKLTKTVSALSFCYKLNQIKARLFNHLERQAVFIHIVHEWIGIHLLDIEYTRFHPLAFYHHLRANHCWNARGIRNRL
jgi:hypothetical protein